MAGIKRYNSTDTADDRDRPPPSPQSVTLNEAIELIGLGRYQAAVLPLCALLMVAESMEVMLLSVLTPVLRCEWGLGDGQLSFMNFMVFTGIFIGAPVMGIVCDRYGRKKGVTIGISIICVFGTLSIAAPSFPYLVAGRFCVGVGLGAMTQSLTHLVEFLPARRRGGIAVGLAMSWGCGTVFAALAGWALLPNGLGWRWLLGVTVLPCYAAAFLYVVFVPESPRYTLSAEGPDKVLRLLRKMAATNGRRVTFTSIEPEPECARGNVRDLFASGELARTSCLLAVCWFAGNVIFYGNALYTTQLLDDITRGLCRAAPNGTVPAASTTTDPRQHQAHCSGLGAAEYSTLVVSSFGEFVGQLGGAYLVEAAGRRPTIAGFGLLYAVLIAAVAAAACAPKLVLDALMFLSRGAAVGSSLLPQVYTVEFYALRSRATAVGLGNMLSRLGSMSSPLVAQYLAAAWYAAPAAVLAAAALAVAVCAALLPVETRGRAMTSH